MSRRRRRILSAAALLATAILATGCTSGAKAQPGPTYAPTPPGTPLTPVTGSSAPPPVPIEASGTATTPGTVNEDAHPITQPVALGAGQATVTTLAYQQPVAAAAKKPPYTGYEWAAARVKMCVAAATSITSKGWQIVLSDGTEVQAESTVQAAFPQPALGPAVRVAAGACATAWVVFAVPANTRPAIITFPGYGGTAVWLTK